MFRLGHMSCYFIIAVDILDSPFVFVIVCFSVLPVSPTYMYTLPHSHGTLYTTLLVVTGSDDVLTFVKSRLKLRSVLKTVLTSSSLVPFPHSHLAL